MSAHQTEGLEAPFDMAEATADFLQSNPDFFNDHPELLDTLEIPHACGQAVSLVEKQLLRLRERNAELSNRLNTLVQVARDNEQLSIRMHKLTLAICDGDSIDDVIQALEERLRRDFQVSHVGLRVLTPERTTIDSSREALVMDASHPDLEVLTPFLKARRPVCGKVGAEQSEALFQTEEDSIGSAAMIPLSTPDITGVLALASPDSSRFQRGMGTLFLTQLGELVAHALQRHGRELAA